MAVLAFLMCGLQILFLVRRPQARWYGWSAGISLASLLYALGVFCEYNAPPDSYNRAAGLAEWTAHLLLIQCTYGFTFAYLGIQARRYHLAAGLFHLLLLVLLWGSHLLVAETFVSRPFLGLSRPYQEAALGPLGPLFELYLLVAALGIVLIWWRARSVAWRARGPYLAGLCFWSVLGIHDGLASLGMPTLLYVMEYGFLGFSLVILWGVFDNYVELATEDKYRVITEWTHDGILVLQDGKAVFGNPACETLVGRPALGTDVEVFLADLTPEDRPRVIACCAGLPEGPHPPSSLVVRLNRMARGQRFVELRANRIQYRHRPAILLVLRDITERIREEEALKESEAKLVRLKKMESLGLLAGGVAHDLNNVLSGIVSYPDLILMNLPAGHSLRRPIEMIQKAGQRAADIVQDLLTVARGVAITREPLNLNRVIREYLHSPEYKKLLQHHPTVTVQTSLDGELLNIKGSEIHLRKVVMNLLSNAAEAITEKGTVVIATENRHLARPRGANDQITTSECAVLSVSDSGSGISAEDQERIFEPFYTKKVMGRSGTGLGLSVVWNVMQDHEGAIKVKSDRQGTCFELYFPATREALAARVAARPEGELSGRGQRVLVIDDLAAQREITCQMLTALGYLADAVAGGEEALAYLAHQPADLLLLDMIMDPGINGRETYERILRLHPGQKAVVVSGYAATEEVQETLRLGASLFLRKPFTLEGLALAVKETLDPQAPKKGGEPTP